ncbi:MAG TPA: DUF4012 domain-containing protein, partial [Egibacteraceae bacterium]|nr:DUF4012 domain-containing protein [Egibacteraceae bacterium]
RAVEQMASAGELIARAGVEIAAAVEALPGGLQAFAPSGGALPLDAISGMSEPMAIARDLIADAQALVAAIPSSGLIDPVDDAYAELSGRVEQAHRASESAAALTEALPAFLGADGPKRYFFGSVNLAELRGSGGFLGAYTILTVDQGRLSFGEFHPIQDLPEVPPSELEPPNADYATRYNRFGGAGKWVNANMTPDGPSAAVALERAYEHVTGDVMDGVVLADPFAFAALLKIAGPTQVPDVGAVNAGNVVDLLSNRAYSEFEDEDVRKRVLGAVAAATLEGFLAEGGGDPARTVRALGEAAAGGHLLLHSTDPDVQAALETVGVAGRLLDPDGDYLAVIINNAAQNKVDYYADRTVRYEAHIHPDGRAVAVAEVELVNHAPSAGVPKRVIGSNRGDELNSGDNLSNVMIYCARTCEPTGFERSDQNDPVAYTEKELGHPVLMSEIRLPSGASEWMRAGWEVEDAWTVEGTAGTYRFTFQGQPTIRPTVLELSIHIPEGMQVTDHSDGIQIDGRVARWSGETSGIASFWVTWDDPEPEGFGARIGEILRRPVVRFGD